MAKTMARTQFWESIPSYYHGGKIPPGNPTDFLLHLIVQSWVIVSTLSTPGLDGRIFATYLNKVRNLLAEKMKD